MSITRFPFVVSVNAASGAAPTDRRFDLMKYLLTLYGDESRYADFTPEQMAENMKSWDRYTQDAIDAGVHLGGEGLQPSATATTVKLEKSGDQIVSDGPFAETKEQLGGFYLLDCKDLDDAIAWAKRIPLHEGTVEVRPVMDYEAVSSQLHANDAKAEAGR
jgi:hypothetical protein